MLKKAYAYYSLLHTEITLFNDTSQQLISVIT